MTEKRQKVYVGMSGGVDSSTVAYLLQKEGYEVTGVFIKVWQPPFFPCTATEDRLDAMRVCALLDIPFKTLDLEEEYKENVVDYMLKEYAAGRTPNPDMMCNNQIKFGAFLNWALQNGAEYVATGHYAKNIFNHKTGEFELHAGDDRDKDQSYFLATLGQKELAHIIFPVGNLKKSKVREIAKQAGLPTALKKDSQGLCFIGTVPMKEFLKHFLKEKPGLVLDKDGKVIGSHEGAIFYTIGERHGFKIDNENSTSSPHYVVKKDIRNNVLFVSDKPLGERGEEKELNLLDIHFVSSKPIEDGEIQVRLRYRGELLYARTEKEGTVLVFEQKVLVSPGQFAVFYKNGICLGSGVIS